MAKKRLIAMGRAPRGARGLKLSSRQIADARKKSGLSHESNLTYAQPLFLLRESNIHFDEKTLEKNAQERTLYHASFFPAYFYAATSTGKRCCPPHPRWIF